MHSSFSKDRVEVRWRLQRNNGKPFPLDNYRLSLTVFSVRGRVVVEKFNITGCDKNILVWEMDAKGLSHLGQCSLELGIFRNGVKVAMVAYKDAFSFFGNPLIELKSFVTILAPERIPNFVNVLFPKMHVDDDMHLIMKGTCERFQSNFRLEENGHLIFNNDNN